MDEPTEKHLGLEARQRRFDAGSKWGGRGGRTLLKASAPSQVRKDGYADVYVQISRPRDEHQNVLVTKIDRELEDVPLEEGKGGLLFKMPEMLEAECLSKTVSHDKHTPDIVITTYTLQGIAWMTPTEKERKRLQERRENRLSLARHSGTAFTKDALSRWSTFCKFQDTPLERITEPSLLDFRAKVPNKARVFEQSQHRAMECHLEGDGEVDLGEDCCVTWVSTQGRFPPIRWTLKNGIRIVHSDHPDYDNWVSKYELSYRVDGGHSWIVANASFKGNEDMTTEVAHALQGGPDGGGLRCRYLRFRPLEFHRSPAMRVGVYGRRPGAEADRASDGVPEDTVVRYSVHSLKEQTNRRRVAGGQGLAAHCCTRKSCRCHTLPSPAVRRRRLRAGAVEEALRPAALELQPIPEQAVGEEPGGSAAGEAEAAEPRCRWESDLSAPPTPASSLGSSAVVVGESGADAAEAEPDADDWLLL